MKNLLIFSVLIFSGFLSAQNSHTFNYRLDYKFPGLDPSMSDMIFARHYIPAQYSEQSKNSLVHFPIFMANQAGYSYVNENQLIQVENSDLENNFNIVKTDLYGYGEPVETLYEKVELNKIDRAPLNVLDRTCNHYEVISTKEGQTKITDFVLCIDETSEIDNVSFLLPKQEGKQIKGLVLAVTSPEGNENEKVLLSSINKINSTIHFDLKKELADYQVKKDSISALYPEEEVAWDEATAVEEYYDYYNYMTQPQFCNYSELYTLKFEDENSISFATSYISSLCNYSYYMKAGDEEKFKTFALKEIKGVKKNGPKSGLISKKDANLLYDFLKKDIDAMEKSTPKTQEDFAVEAAVVAADEALEAVAAYDYSQDYYVGHYESEYESLTPESMNFAFETLSANSAYWKAMPAYCKNMDTVIPKFSNEELSKHAKNYAGQICDMYMGEFEGSSVWYKGTLDAIRAEQIYFNNNRDKFSKKDKELLDEFLNNLD